MKLVEAGADITTMTKYRSDLDVPVALPEQEVQETLAEVLSEHGVRQLHVAETEKYAHVTYFFNGGREQEWAGETRILVPSPRDVASYDQKPEMSAREVTARFVEELDRDGYRFAVLNLANPGHGRPHRIHSRRGESRRDSRRMPGRDRRGGRAETEAWH